MSSLVDEDHQRTAREAKRLLSSYEGSRDLIELGAHQRGSNPVLDQAIDTKPALDAVLTQSSGQSFLRGESLAQLRRALATAPAAQGTAV